MGEQHSDHCTDYNQEQLAVEADTFPVVGVDTFLVVEADTFPAVAADTFLVVGVGKRLVLQGTLLAEDTCFSS